MSPAPPRLVIDGRRLSARRTGVGRYLECLLEEWSRSGLPSRRTHVALADPAGLASVPRAEGLTAEVVAPRLPGLLWERFGLGRMLRPGDLLFAPSNLVPPGWPGPTVLVLFDALQEVRPDDFGRLARLRFAERYRLAAGSADRVIVPTRATAIDLERVYGVEGERVAVIRPEPGRSFHPRPGDDPEVRAARESLGLGGAGFFLFAGKRSARRNVPAVLAGFEGHRRRYPEHLLVFLGQGEGRGADVDRPGVVDAGHVPDPVLRGLMASALGVLYPSEMEGFGLPIVEAMASGCPVVTLRRPALVEAGGDAPLYLDEATPASLADAMGTLASDPEARARHVRRGLDRAGRDGPRRFAASVAFEIRRTWADALGVAPARG